MKISGTASGEKLFERLAEELSLLTWRPIMSYAKSSLPKRESGGVQPEKFAPCKCDGSHRRTGPKEPERTAII